MAKRELDTEPSRIEHQENLERVKFFWYNKLRKRIQEIEEKEWLTTINNKPKLRTYKHLNQNYN